ncbi:glycoside hydrolase family 2 protein [Curtobacterium sp. USHLN213]|uniref:glycoside hydrolase family 2 protein n=1 Tax=Curtobacterium sp. USHLN213 TaxID=3081255 RepID=UPI003018A6C7
MSKSTTSLHDFEIIDTDLHASIDEVSERDGWIAASIPGGVHEALIASGRIPHPYRDRNEEAVRWVEERAWWYRTTFTFGKDASPEELALVFHGLDTVADVWLNRVHLGHHENMFRPASFEVGALIRADNELLVRFLPPLAGLVPPAPATLLEQRLAAVLTGSTEQSDVPASGGMSEMHALSTLRRKAVCSWGWDFGPRVPSIGIWRPVDLISIDGPTLSGHHVRTDHIDERGAHLTIRAEVERADDTDAEVLVRMTSPNGRETTARFPIHTGRGGTTVIVPEPELWWTHDLGTPALYDVEVELLDANGAALDRVRDRIGLRTVTLDRSPDPEGGQLFRFVLNGFPVFARGAAWLPADLLVGSVTDDRYRTLLERARDANITMLRVWGGGIYEADAFYALTDELGVLIWQDFMFACTDYPEADPTLRAEVDAEARYQVSRLRNRASIALWSGNNEVHMLHGFAFQDYEEGEWGRQFFHDLLPSIVETLDGGVPYWPGSPYGDDLGEGWMAVNGVLDGDRHSWEVWHGTDMGAGGGPYSDPGQAAHYRRYANDHGKFISEFGIHASPALETLERWIEADSLDIHSESFDAHMKDRPKDKGDALLRISTGIPRTMREYVDATMAAQAEGLKFGIEHFRRRQPHCSGTLWWQFNDVWPGFSWSVIDFDAVPKASYYAMKRVFAPIVASFVETSAGLELWVSNSSREVTTGTVSISVEDSHGQKRVDTSMTFEVEAGASQRVWAQSETLRHGEVAWATSADGSFPTNRYFAGEVRDLDLEHGDLSFRVRRTGPTSAAVTVTATVFTYQVSIASPWNEMQASDNYFDLAAGDSATIELDGLAPDFDTADITVRSYQGPSSR